MSLSNCGEPSPNDKNGPCPDSSDRRGPCRCIDEPGHADDHGCKCGDAWPRTPQPAGMYLRLDVTEWSLISSYHDGSAVIGAWGPFASEEDVATAQAVLLEAGIDLQRCTVLPIRRVVSQP